MKTIIALLYDFDKTLCTQDMQNYTFIPALGMEPGSFWQEANLFGQREEMDSILAYMYMMLKKSRELNVPLTRDFLRQCGRSIDFFPGVQDWFGRVNAHGAALGVEVEHYVSRLCSATSARQTAEA